MVNCEGCRFRSAEMGALGPHCNYLMFTGRTRLGQMTGEQRAEQRRTGVCNQKEEGLPRREIEAPRAHAYQVDKMPPQKAARYPEDPIRELYEQGLDDPAIARMTGCERQTVMRFRKKYGLPSNRKKQQEAVEALYLELYGQGLMDREIAEKAGRSDGSVCAWRKKNRLPANGGPKPVDWPRVRRLYMDGFNDREISEILGIHQHTVADWRQKNKLPANRFVNAENKRKEDER